MSGERSTRTVWITGASSGIGSALVEAFVQGGDRVFATARTEEKLRSLQDRFGEKMVLAFPCDIQDAHAISSAAHCVQSTWGSVDILVNNAGITSFKDFAGTSIDEFDRIIATNLRGMFATTSAVLPEMLARKRGLIINVLSYTTKAVFERSAAYSASKAGAEAMMNVLRAEVRRSGIRVVNVSPGAVKTPIWTPRQQEKFGEQMLHAADVARVVYDVSIQPESVMIEDIVIRPVGGDLQ